MEGEAINNNNRKSDVKKAFGVIILFGLVSLFGDLAYEGARSVNGPYLKLLAVNAATLGLISGLGELLGYALRLLSGYLADKTKSYWFLTFLGYGMLVSVPLLSLAGVWQVAAVLIIMERIGKAIRSPARDTILSQASSQVGTGFGFGLHEAMDQIGAIIGPLIFTIFFLTAGRNLGIYEYQKGYAFLWIPFLLVMFCLFMSYRKVPRPQLLEVEKKGVTSDKLSRIFWLYNLFAFFATAGFCSFILVAYHFKLTGFLTDAQIPLFYALAMGVDALAALAIGKAYDILKDKSGNLNSGLNLLVLVPLISILMLFFIFSSRILFIIIGLILWGIVMGIQETIMRSAIADTTSLRKRGTGYGIFNTTYGVAIFLGSFLFGLLYDRDLYLVFIGALILEVIALVVFKFMRKEILLKRGSLYGD